MLTSKQQALSSVPSTEIKQFPTCNFTSRGSDASGLHEHDIRMYIVCIYIVYTTLTLQERKDNKTFLKGGQIVKLTTDMTIVFLTWGNHYNVTMQIKFSLC